VSRADRAAPSATVATRALATRRDPASIPALAKWPAPERVVGRKKKTHLDVGIGRDLVAEPKCMIVLHVRRPFVNGTTLTLKVHLARTRCDGLPAAA